MTPSENTPLPEGAYDAMIAYAVNLGHQHGANAAGWWEQDAIGGRAPARTTLDVALASLQGIRDGDPAVTDELPAPNLSGEWAGDLTGPDLLVDAAGAAGVDPEDDAQAAAAQDAFGEVCEAYERAYYDAVQNAVETACLNVIEAAAADAKERGDQAEYRRLRQVQLGAEADRAEDAGDPYPGWGAPQAPVAAAAAEEGSTPTPEAGGPHEATQAADAAPNAYRAAAEAARRAAAEAALHGAEWLGNGGPAGYDLPEACHHLEAALASARLALQYHGLAERYHRP